MALGNALKRLSSRRSVTLKSYCYGNWLCYPSGNDEYQMVLTLQMTGSLWLGLGDHLFNNLASNLVHVVSNSDVDSFTDCENTAMAVVVVCYSVMDLSKN